LFGHLNMILPFPLPFISLSALVLILIAFPGVN
jgi:hypothetical protein